MLIQETDDDQDVGEKEEGGWVVDRLESFSKETFAGGDKDKAHTQSFGLQHSQKYLF